MQNGTSALVNGNSTHFKEMNGRHMIASDSLLHSKTPQLTEEEKI
jgi:hypothetical protein